MVLNRLNQRVFYRNLYRGTGSLIAVTFRKRGADQSMGTYTDYVLQNCLLPGTKVEGRFLSASKSRYAGEALELVLEGSLAEPLRITVNHPVLTLEGFVPAGRLQPDMYLLCDVGCDKVGGDKNVENGPALVENVFESFAKSGLADSSHPSPLDFHGDGKAVKGKIKTVFPDRELLMDCPSERTKRIGYPVLNGALGTSRDQATFETGFGSAAEFLGGSFSANKNLVASLYLPLPLFRGRPGPLELLPVMSGTKRDSLFQENLAEGGEIGFQVFDEGTERFPRSIAVEDFLGSCSDIPGPSYASFGLGSRFDVVRPEEFQESRYSDSEFRAELSKRFPGEVAAKKIVSIRRFHYEGPVYDLESPVGYYISFSGGNKPFISNCRMKKSYRTKEVNSVDMTADDRCVWQIPLKSLEDAGLSPLSTGRPVFGDMILNNQDSQSESYGTTWMVESFDLITQQLFGDVYNLDCKRHS